MTKPRAQSFQRVVFKAIDAFNSQMGDEQSLPKALDAPIFGRNGHLTSLGLVNFVVETEEKINDELGTRVALADDKAMSRQRSPFRTVESLIDYIAELLGDGCDD